MSRHEAGHSTTTIAAMVTGALLIAAACGGGADDASGPALDASTTTAPVETTAAPDTTSAPTTTPETTTLPEATVAATAPTPDPTSPPTTAELVDDETWRDEVDAACRHGVGVFSIPDTGEVLARIDTPSLPVKLQPADGTMVVRTATSYELIDASTNTIVGSLLKSDVGPEANRSWAVDGAMWICDGRGLHRYDPATLTSVALIDLDVDCGHPYATDDLVVAWSYNEDPGESGTSRAAFIDPATNSVIATVDLAADAGVPVVLDDHVFFPPLFGTQASVIDRSTWTVASAPDLGRFFDAGSQPAFDGTSMYVIASKAAGTIAVIDPATFEVNGELLAVGPDLGLNSLAATPGTLWAVNNSGGLLQRFDTAS